MKAYNYRHKFKTFQLLLLYYDVIITLNVLILSVKLYFIFSTIKNKFFCRFVLSFLMQNIKFVESAKQKDITDVM